ncbi:MAG: hypothetical protein Q7T50_07500 [Candidatus Magasanikbacteria bacterium]|nr:hypothetical protein [Candidatus Magasanikbacteria bacterium]
MALSKSLGINPKSQGISGLVGTRFAISQEVKTGFLNDKTSFWSFLVSIIFVLLEVLLIALYWRRLPPEIPLFYSKPWGSAMLAHQLFIWLIPLIAFLFLFVNFCIVIFFMQENKFLNRVMCVTSLLIGFTTFYGLLRILTLLA